MNRTAAVAVATVLLLGAQPILGQDAPPELRPGDPSLDVTPVRAGTDSLAIFVIDGDEAFVIGHYVVETNIARGMITRTDRMFGLQEELLWGEEAVLEDETLRPVSVHTLSGDARRVTFEGGTVVREWTEGDVAREQRADLGSPAFHATSLDFVLRSLPLETGYQASILILDIESLAEYTLPIRVAREVAVQDANGNSSTTWEVHVDLGGAADVYHLDQESGAVIRYESAADRMVMLRW